MFKSLTFPHLQLHYHSPKSALQARYLYGQKRQIVVQRSCNWLVHEQLLLHRRMLAAFNGVHFV